MPPPEDAPRVDANDDGDELDAAEAAAFVAKWSACDDEPPPLDSLPEQMEALRLYAAEQAAAAAAGGKGAAGGGSGGSGSGGAAGAATPSPPAAAKPAGVKRGFFDSPRAKASPAKARAPRAHTHTPHAHNALTDNTRLLRARVCVSPPILPRAPPPRLRHRRWWS